MKLAVALVCATLAVASGFTMTPAAPVSHTVRSSRLLTASADSAISMRCRTNTKREKFFRNLENAKRFRKSSWKPYKSNKGESEEDTSYIATIYVATDASGEAIESAEGAAEVAEGAAA